MKTTIEILDAVRARHGLTSDYQLAKFLAITPQRISHYRAKKETLGELTAIKAAAALKLDAGYVLACMAAERAKTAESRAAWQRLAARAAMVAVITLCAILWGGEQETNTLAALSVAPISSGSMYIMLSLGAIIVLLKQTLNR